MCQESMLYTPIIQNLKSFLTANTHKKKPKKYCERTTQLTAKNICKKSQKGQKIWKTVTFLSRKHTKRIIFFRQICSTDHPYERSCMYVSVVVLSLCSKIGLKSVIDRSIFDLEV